MIKNKKVQVVSLFFVLFFLWAIFLVPIRPILEVDQNDATSKPSPTLSSESHLLLPQKPSGAKSNFLDDFNYNNTHPNWTLVKKNGNIRQDYPYLNLTTFSGSNQDWWTTLFNAPFCYVTLPTGNFIMTTKLVNPLDLPDLSTVGLLLYEDDQHVSFYGQKRAGSEKGIRIEGFTGNTERRLASNYVGTTSVQYFSISRNNTMYNFQYSFDGITWYSLANYTTTNLGFTPHYGGLMNKKWGSTGYSAYFEYFYLYDNYLEVIPQTPANRSYYFGSTGNSVSWKITDIYAPHPTYDILRDGSSQQTGTWTSGNPISFNADGLGLGVFNFTIVVEDGAGEHIENQIFINVIANEAPTITPLSDIGFENCSIWRNVTWMISDAYVSGPSYVVKIDDAEYENGVWTSGVPVTINLDSLPIDQYNLTLIAADGFGEVSQDEINVTIVWNSPPKLSSPQDRIIEEGDPDSWINWNIADDNISTTSYAIYCNETLNSTGVWNSGAQVAMNLTTLGIGCYNITLIVDDGWGVASQDEVLVDVRRNSVLAYALVIGINDYPGTDNDLQCCIADATGMSEMLQGVGFPAQNVYYLADSQATEINIVAKINEIAQHMDSNDIFVIYYSGHGDYVVNSSALGSCNIHTPHNYPNNYYNYWTIHHEGALGIRVRFTNFNVESNYYDIGFVADASMYGYAYSGNLGSFWSDWILGDTCNVGLDSDSSITRYGFDVTQYEIMTSVNGSIVTYDYATSGEMWGQELDKALSVLPIGCEQYLFFDSCMSGGLIPALTQPDRAVMAACASNEYSLEDTENSHGVFTYYLLQAFDTDESGYLYDTNLDGYLSMNEVFAYVEPNTIARSTALGSVHHPQLNNQLNEGRIWDFDADNDNISDYEEIMVYNTNPDNFDTDGDSLPDNFEIFYNLDACVGDSFVDTDSDGLSNLAEYTNHTNPVNPDTDDDGLLDGEEVDLYGTSPLISDSDNDGMPDGWEINNSFNPFVDDGAEDPDGDGLLNLNEYQIGADPYNSDTDGDSLSDGWEYNNLLDPTIPNDEEDTDIDGLTNLQEFQEGTSPVDADTENDGMPDGWEVAHSFDPLANDASGDADSDGLNNVGEYQHGADPHDTDTDDDLMLDGYEHTYGLNITVNDAAGDLDADGLTNYQECQLGTYPNDSDSENDGMPDGWEVAQSFDPLANDSSGDADSDGLNNVGEYQHGADPHDTDTDDDLMLDGYEHTYGLNITVNDAAGDLDADGLTNYQECQLGTYPNDSDSDNDGLNDGLEVKQYGSDPLRSDTDQDGLSDYTEVFTYKTDPTKADTDEDALTDKEEIQTYKTSPTKSDTDNDKLSDGQEVKTYRTDPLRADTDNDNWMDGDEVLWGTDPRSRYSNPGGYVALLFVGIIGVVVTGAVVYRKRHSVSYRSTPPRWSSPSSPSWNTRASPSDYYPPSRITSQEPTYRGLTADQWAQIGNRAMRDNNPIAGYQAYAIARQLRDRTPPKSSPQPQPSNPNTFSPTDRTSTISNIVMEKFRTAMSQYKIGSFVDAAENLRAVVKLNPSHSTAWHLLGLTLRAQHEDVGAEQAFRNSLNHDPRNPEVWLSLAEVYADTGRTSDAIDAANHAIDIAPRAWVGCVCVENILNKMVDKQKASADFLTPMEHSSTEGLESETGVNFVSKNETQSANTSENQSSQEIVRDNVPKPTSSSLLPAPNNEEHLREEAKIEQPLEKIPEPSTGTPPIENTCKDTQQIEDPASNQHNTCNASVVPRENIPEPWTSNSSSAASPHDVIQKCGFCNNFVKDGECLSCGAKVCPHCGETNFANAKTCANCRNDF